MSGCRSHAEQVGAYGLGALEPDEMEEMRAHLAGCPRCAAEVRSFSELPAMLDLVGADAEVAVPSPGLEEEVLDRYVRERARATPRRRRWPRLAIPAVAVAALVAALLVVVLPGDTSTAYAHAELWSLPAGGGAEGTADAAKVPAGTRVKLRADHLPVSRGTTYELWCVRTDGRWINGGSFQARADGTAAAELTAAVKPGEYHVVVITRRSASGTRGAEVMRGKLTY
ncbi:MAG: zf-HC2 domain-containing protein [Thermoleophilaceae bacterium]